MSDAPSLTGRPGALWAGRPPGLPAGVPPPSIPLRFLASSAFGLVACGVALVVVRATITRDPTADAVVGAAHFAMLSTLTMALLGALHQFTPVITQRALRSLRLSRATFLTWFAAAWLLPLGFVTRKEVLVEAGGAFAATAVTLLVVNLSSALAVRSSSPAVTGLRLSVVGFVLTACYGVVYVIDRRTAWFDLRGHVVLAHACVGLFAWLGLAYVSVAQKLWPMFMLSHVPGRQRSSWVSVISLFLGTIVLSVGLLAGATAVSALGALGVATGLTAHLYALVRSIHHRRRRADLHLVYIVASACWLVVGVTLASVGAFLARDANAHAPALIAASVAAVAGWLLVAIIGHTFKIVPFIAWSALRGRGVSATPTGTSLMFADLFNRHLSVLDFALVNAAVASLIIGIVSSRPLLVAVAGVSLVAAGLLSAAALSWRPVRLLSTTHSS